ncbi:hypothetical protein HAX54_027487 [Datura stramonium]|uniref:Uncharacterized protein n=1 Tax=Datura stramonium TaxID=4076 RepID=A0ABS8V5A7_DATST|nr:hypothetical protein [Datura stramonium]
MLQETQETNTKIEIIISSLDAAKKFDPILQPATGIHEARQTSVLGKQHCLLDQITALTKFKEKRQTSYDNGVAEDQPSNSVGVKELEQKRATLQPDSTDIVVDETINVVDNNIDIDE